MKTKIKILLFLIIITAILDVWTAIKSPLVHYYETNPFFVWLPSVWTLIILKLVVVCGIWWAYNKYDPGRKVLFHWVLLGVLFLVGQCFGIYGNLSSQYTIKEYQEGLVASGVSEVDAYQLVIDNAPSSNKKLWLYGVYSFFGGVLPYFLGMVSFWLWCD